MEPQESFGRLPRGEAWKLATRKVSMRPSRYGKRSPMSASSSAFARDEAARPLMFSDGHLADVVYGALSPVPCPSCSHALSGRGCQVCEGHGVILMPEEDLDSYRGAFRFDHELDVLIPDKHFIPGR